MPGIGSMKRRLETEKQAVALAISGIIKQYNTNQDNIKTLETQYDNDSGDWYVAVGFSDRRAVVKMDSVHATILEINEV
ncbi:MAG: hypothetical protein EB163_07745 [Nitrososphaeria archaeon]|nr:hypothetical protein [Nitrososphaeria archaeon]